MATVYKTPRQDGGQTYAYQCGGDVAIGDKLCGRVSGGPLDRAVVEACLARLAPIAVGSVREAWRQARGDERAEQHRRELGLHRARAREADVRHRFFSVDADNRLVAADLEKESEATKRDVQRLERLIQSAPQTPVIFDEAAFEELMTLCADISAIWNAPTTTNQDRKELLRTMIHSVRIEERTPESIRVAIEWADGAPASVLDVGLARRAHRQIQELADEGVAPGEIVLRLNRDGILTLKGRPWTRHAVIEVLKRAQRRASRVPARLHRASAARRAS